MRTLSRKPCFAGRAARLLVVAILGSNSAVRSASPPKNEPIVELSPYEVSAASVDFAKWIKVATPNFLIYTDARLSEACALLTDFEKLRFAGQRYFRRPARVTAPVTLVLPTSGSDWSKIASKGNVQWDVAVSNPIEDPVGLILVQYDWQTNDAKIARAPVGRTIVASLNLDGPFWFMRGVGSLFESAEIEADAVHLGLHSSRVRGVAVEGWLDWDRFFKLSSNSPEFRSFHGVKQLDGQCSLFVQYCMSHAEPIWRDRLIRWVALLAADREPTETEFMAVFGQSWAKWGQTMRNYLQSGRYQITKVPIRGSSMNFEPIRLDLPIREMRELFILSQVSNQDRKASHVSLDALLARGLKSESLREILAATCLKLGRREAGREALLGAIDAGTANPSVYTLAGKLALEDELPALAIHSSLPLQAAQQIRSWAEIALRLDPRHPEAHKLRAFAIALSPGLEDSHLALLEASYRQLLGDTSTSDVLTALLLARHRRGDTRGAHALAQQLSESPFSSSNAKRIAQVVLAVPSPSAPAAAAPPHAKP